ncbi:ABC-type antimicrobial peptide transport system, permease component [Mucilaginibacter mallensis]|uniref:ABC-type antimicrobial peptide transport system, permease component n=1 Tax=Mucilaginibacter mallensis TaxID=652787 RepID=A0A1H1MPX4_MUCMA|nr:ABC transporter permease [Mucilaginibacter mallensis]SDR88712.1 ABC-type antimicrobial peptide transport system, permease component [Mucilaginibacter mallensis]
MIKNYFRTALRYFQRNKVTTLINILGLSTGISAALIIFMMIRYDRSFDQFEPAGERVYRVVTDGDGWKNQGVPVPLAEALKQNVSGIETVAAVYDYNDWNTKVIIPQGSSKPDKIFKKQQQIAFADAGYFNILPHRWLAGNPAGALKNPNTLVLSESRAKVYFPGLSPDQIIGKMVIFSDTVRTTVTGIVADLEAKSDFDKQCFLSLNTVYNTSLKKDYQTDQWESVNSNNEVLVKLSPKVSAATINRQIAAIFKLHNKDADGKTVRRLQALADIHLNPDFGGSVNPAVIRNLAILAIFLLALGAINFINLSTAHASERAKEIGIRKTLGSGKGQLMTQFLSETFLLTLITAIVSTALVPLLLKVFSGFIPKGLNAAYLFRDPGVWLFLLALIIGVSLVAGLYPAFIMSAFRPVTVLKDNKSTASGSAWLRKTLIVSQFVIAQVFVIGVLVVDKQLHFAEAKNMGFRKDAIINFYVPFDFNKPNPKKLLLKQELAGIPGIQAVSLGNQSPAFNGFMSTEVDYKEKGKNINLSVNSRDGDTAYLSVYRIKLVAGRNVTASDTANELLINETLAKQIGFSQPAAAVGHFLQFGNGQLPIVGVMQDFNQASVRTSVAPMIYFSAPKRGYVMHVALQTDPASWNKAIQQMTAAWKSVYPDTDFDYTFLDKTVENFYKEDRQLSLLLTWSAGIAIFISCLGMLGLVIFMTNKRVKEIGVRKVLGASVRQIITLLAADFAKLLVLAFIIAVPIAWWQMHKWLQNFAYHTALNWWLFLLGGVVMITVALIIVGIRAGKAAMANPADSLRTE